MFINFILYNRDFFVAVFLSFFQVFLSNNFFNFFLKFFGCLFPNHFRVANCVFCIAKVAKLRFPYVLSTLIKIFIDRSVFILKAHKTYLVNNLFCGE